MMIIMLYFYLGWFVLLRAFPGLGKLVKWLRVCFHRHEIYDGLRTSDGNFI